MYSKMVIVIIAVAVIVSMIRAKNLGDETITLISELFLN